jgi:hypothetical protein
LIRKKKARANLETWFKYPVGAVMILVLVRLTHY